MRARTALLLLCLLPAARARRAPQSTPEIPLDKDDLEITGSVRVKPGTYTIRDARGDGAVRITASGATIDFQGAELVGAAPGAEPDAFDGVGIVIEGANGVTVKNARLRGFRVGIEIRGGKGLRIENCDVGGMRRMRLRSTPEREDGADWLWPHRNDEGEWARNYGAGIWARNCTGATFAGNHARESQNGILLDRCQDCDVFDNDCSFLSGWGLALWRSSGNRVAHNRFDWCVRGYSHGVYDRGQDSAGILVFEQCNDNVFAYNSATHGGDGFFLYAGNETLERTGEGGCNRNFLYRNDFSHAVANGIEATFSDGNVFAENVIDDCSQHGVWGGFSSNTIVVQNRITNCGGGVSIEHGHDNAIEGNVFENCRAAIELWSNVKTDFAEKPYGKKREIRSLRNRIRQNVLRGNALAVDLRRTEDTSITYNLFDGNRGALRCGEGVNGLTFERNLFRAGTGSLDFLVRNETGGALRLGANAWGVPEPSAFAGPRVALAPALARDPVVDPKETGARRAAPKVKGSLDAFLATGTPRGRATIVIGPWGPLDPREPGVSPGNLDGWGEARFLVLGAGRRFEVGGLPTGLRADPPRGTAPASVKITGDSGARAGVKIFEAEVRIEGAAAPFRVAGSIVLAAWNVAFRAWDAATEDPRSGEGAWAKILGKPPLASFEAAALDFAWGSSAPAAGVPADRFATVAETTLDLPEGAYLLTTVSDDGIRVFVDGKVVLEDWTWHPPKEVRAALTLSEGSHAVRVEHFEIDGHASLSVKLTRKEPR